MKKFSWGKVSVWLLTAAAMAVMMNQYREGGKWLEMKGRVREKWGDLTDDDFSQAHGKLEELASKIQQKYGGTKEQVRRQLHEISKPEAA
ncbi:MAG: ral stress protein CsbD [Dehalococcoidia bacterium]|nr:ral stress protein CsbD [Dehalococcoidia bacterium]